jgi:hypothetical protein
MDRVAAERLDEGTVAPELLVAAGREAREHRGSEWSSLRLSKVALRDGPPLPEPKGTAMGGMFGEEGAPPFVPCDAFATSRGEPVVD